jgi:ATP/maltotriose-dependent transcriptional regulator MalT
VVDEQALAFTHDEAAKLFADYGLSVPQADIALALAHTRGRVASLCSTISQMTKMTNMMGKVA